MNDTRGLILELAKNGVTKIFMREKSYEKFKWSLLRDFPMHQAVLAEVALTKEQNGMFIYATTYGDVKVCRETRRRDEVGVNMEKITDEQFNRLLDQYSPVVEEEE